MQADVQTAHESSQTVLTGEVIDVITVEEVLCEATDMLIAEDQRAHTAELRAARLEHEAELAAARLQRCEAARLEVGVDLARERAARRVAYQIFAVEVLAALVAGHVVGNAVTIAANRGCQRVEREDLAALEHGLKRSRERPLQHRLALYRTAHLYRTCREWQLSPLSAAGTLPYPTKPSPKPYSHLSGPAFSRLMVIMFLCAWRLPSFGPQPCA